MNTCIILSPIFIGAIVLEMTVGCNQPSEFSGKISSDEVPIPSLTFTPDQFTVTVPSLSPSTTVVSTVASSLELTPAPNRTKPPIATPIPKPTLSVNIEVIPSTTMLAVGDTLTVTVTVENYSIGCDFPSYTVKLTSEVGWGTQPINYEFLSPSTVEQKGNSTTTFTLVMIEPGYITQLGAIISGKHNCNGSWEQAAIPGGVQNSGISRSGNTITGLI